MDKHPIPLTCKKCGGELKLKRFRIKGERFRKYYCQQCGYTAVFKREKNIYL